MEELKEIKKAFDEFIIKAEKTLARLKETKPKNKQKKEEKKFLEDDKETEPNHTFEFTLTNGNDVIIEIYYNGFAVIDKSTNKNITFDLSQKDFDLISERLYNGGLGR